MDKTCSKCGEARSPEAFPKVGRRCKACLAGYLSAWHVANRERRLAANRARAAANPDKDRERGWRQRSIDITYAQYLEMFEAQQRKCLLCRRAYDKLHVDHDHATGTVRGLLCNGCNRGIGFFQDNPELLDRAAQYVRTHKQG